MSAVVPGSPGSVEAPGAARMGGYAAGSSSQGAANGRWGPGGRPAHARTVIALLLRNPTFDVGAAILLFWIVDAVLWPAFTPHDPLAQNLLASLQAPSGTHWLGTDNLGRDVLARVLAGASSILTVAPLATAMGLAGGIMVGLVVGYYRGAIDAVVMRIVDALLSFPTLIIGVLVLSVLGSSEVAVIVVIGVVFTPLVARTVRAAVLVERDKEYVAAARLRGEPGLYIMVSEILPNVTGPIVVEGTVRLGYAIYTAAALSFIGLGLQDPSPDWGLTIADERTFLQVQIWTVLGPAIALGTLVVAVNLVADGIRTALYS